MLALHVGLLVFSHFVRSSQQDMRRNMSLARLREEQQNADDCMVLWPSWDFGVAEKRPVLVGRTGVVVRDGRMVGDRLLVVHHEGWVYSGSSLLAFQSRRAGSVLEVHLMDPSSPWSVLVVPQREEVEEAAESDTHVLDPSWVFVDLDVRTVGGRDALMADGPEDMAIQADAKMARRDIGEQEVEEVIASTTRSCLAIVQKVVLLAAGAFDQALQYPS